MDKDRLEPQPGQQEQSELPPVVSQEELSPEADAAVSALSRPTGPLGEVAVTGSAGSGLSPSPEASQSLPAPQETLQAPVNPEAPLVPPPVPGAFPAAGVGMPTPTTTVTPSDLGAPGGSAGLPPAGSPVAPTAPTTNQPDQTGADDKKGLALRTSSLPVLAISFLILLLLIAVAMYALL